MLAGVMAHAWPDTSPATLAAWVDRLAAFDHDRACEAVHSLVESGRRYAPQVDDFAVHYDAALRRQAARDGQDTPLTGADAGGQRPPAPEGTDEPPALFANRRDLNLQRLSELRAQVDAERAANPSVFPRNPSSNERRDRGHDPRTCKSCLSRGVPLAPTINEDDVAIAFAAGDGDAPESPSDVAP